MSGCFSIKTSISCSSRLNDTIFPCGMDTELKIQLPVRVTNFINKFDSLSNSPEKRLLIKALKFDIFIPDANNQFYQY